MYIGWTPHHPSIRQISTLNVREIEYEISEEAFSSGITQKTSSPMGVKPLTFQNSSILEGHGFDSHWGTKFSE